MKSTRDCYASGRAQPTAAWTICYHNRFQGRLQTQTVAVQLGQGIATLDKEIHTLKEREPILQHKVESSVHGLTEIELS